MNKSGIETGQIWEVVTDHMWGIEANRRGYKASLKRGEKIEIRYPYAWHFRTTDDVYLQASSKEIYENCKLIGKIDEGVRFGNKHGLAEILKDKLYTTAWENGDIEKG